VRSGDVRQVCHRLLQRLALARRATYEFICMYEFIDVTDFVTMAYDSKLSLLGGTLCLVGICGSGFVCTYPSGRIPTHPFRVLGLLARGSSRTDVGSCKYQGRTAVWCEPMWCLFR
jgi:hypothetical protein